MFVTTHVLVGAAIGRVLARHPVAAFGAGVASHFVMDACPHWGTATGEMDEQFMRVAYCDGCAGLTAMAVAAGLCPGPSRRSVVAGMVGGALVDMDKPCRAYLGFNPFPGPVQRFHKRIQNEAPERLRTDILVAAVLAAATFSFLRP